MKRFISLLLSVFLVLSVFGYVIADEKDVLPEKAAVEKAIDTDIKTDTAATAKSASEDITPNDLKKEFKAQLSSLILTLEGLRAQCKLLWNNISSLNQQIKKVLAETKPDSKDPKVIKQAYVKMLEGIKPLREQVSTIHKDILTQRKLKEAEWVKYRAAVKSKNIDSAKEAMNSIILYKGLIVADQQKLVVVKTSILDVVKSYVAPTVTITPKPTQKPKPTPRPKATNKPKATQVPKDKPGKLPIVTPTPSVTAVPTAAPTTVPSATFTPVPTEVPAPTPVPAT